MLDSSEARHDEARHDTGQTRDKLGDFLAYKPILLNLGCGSIIHDDWHNFDIAPRDPAIRDTDFRKRLPFRDASVDAVYHSHVLEHLDRDEARWFLHENFRVLKPGATLRVVVPDLQRLCEEYLSALDMVEEGAPGAAELYEWSLIDLMDQMVRRRNAGKMLEFLESIDLHRHPHVGARLTHEMRGYLTARRNGAAGAHRHAKLTWHEVSWRLRHGTKRLRERAARIAVRAIAGRQAAASFTEGLFRNEGEVHQWMYDPYSLRHLMEEIGLVDVELVRADESGIPGFADCELDTVGGRVRRPGSIFAEGRKPVFA